MQKGAYDQLVAENRELNSYKRQVLILEQEKRELESKIHTYRESSPAKSIVSDEDSKGQIDFLNSVIVDMQRKNDELKGKLDLLGKYIKITNMFSIIQIILESAGILETIDIADMAMLNGIDTNRVAPRLFCDICDQFDLHDTEDCPTQAMEIEPQLALEHTKSGAQRGAVREYCTNCEMFGHSVDKCENEAVETW